MMRVYLFPLRIFPVLLLMLVTWSCSHDYSHDSLDLGKYQWNMWPEMGADPAAQPGSKTMTVHEPSCGWEKLDRGMGKLVRIPAQQESHFEPEEQSTVVWFHVRHTLPELWADRDITLHFGGVSHSAEIYLNGELVGSFEGSNTPFSLDITEKVYYVRDNHLAIRAYDPEPELCGITGKILVVSTPLDQAPKN